MSGWSCDVTGKVRRLYFDLVSNDDIIYDTIGVAVINIDEAIRHAHEVVSEIAQSGELAAGEDRWSMIVRDENGEVVTTLWVSRSPNAARTFTVAGSGLPEDRRN